MGSESIDSSDFDSSESHSEAKRARRIIVLVKSNELVKNIGQTTFGELIKARRKSSFAAKNPALFATSGL